MRAVAKTEMTPEYGDDGEGVLLSGVVEGATAAKAGLKEGDLIVAFGELPVRGIDDLLRLLTEDLVGAPVLVTVVRGTERRQIAVTPTESQKT